jgi:hypothetical protein
MRELAIATSDAFVLVYSVDDEASFEAVTDLREQILREKVCFLVVLLFFLSF